MCLDSEPVMLHATHANHLSPTVQVDRFVAEIHECKASSLCLLGQLHACPIIPYLPAALKNKPHMLPTQVVVHVTSGQRSLTAFIYQKSHSSGERTVILAAAEPVFSPVKAQLPTPQYQILDGRSRQLSTKWRLRTDRRRGSSETGTANHITKAVYSFLPHRSISIPSQGAQIALQLEAKIVNACRGIVLLNTKQFNYWRPVGWQA